MKAYVIKIKGNKFLSEWIGPDWEYSKLGSAKLFENKSIADYYVDPKEEYIDKNLNPRVVKVNILITGV